MSTASWQLDEPIAHLRSNRVSARINVARPQEGLCDLGVGEEKISGNFLCLRLSTEPQDATEALVESYIRTTDLIVTYPETANRPFHVQTSWRSINDVGQGSLAALELIALVKTNLLDSRPCLSAGTHLRVEEVLRLVDLKFDKFEPLPLAEEAPMALGNGEGLCCILCRLEDGRHSYAEMVLPGDSAAASVAPAAGGKVSSRYIFFARSLEKGVILRARLRGLLLNRRDDAQIAATWYRSLLAG